MSLWPARLDGGVISTGQWCDFMRFQAGGVQHAPPLTIACNSARISSSDGEGFIVLIET